MSSNAETFVAHAEERIYLPPIAKSRERGRRAVAAGGAAVIYAVLACLFVFEARPAPEGVEVLIRYSPPEPQVHQYVFLLRPREIESTQFPWIFQKQLYDCLHDFIVEMFTCNP